MKKSEFSYFRHVSFLLHCCTFLSAPFLYGRGAFFRWIGGGSPFQRETDLLSRFFYDVCFFSMSFASCMYAFWPDGCICCICCPLWFHGFMLSICAGLVFSFPTPSVMVLREILCNCLAERLCCKETMAMTAAWRAKAKVTKMATVARRRRPGARRRRGDGDGLVREGGAAREGDGGDGVTV